MPDLGLRTGEVTARMTVPDAATARTVVEMGPGITRTLPGGWQATTELAASPQIHLVAGAGTPGVQLGPDEQVRIWLCPEELATTRLAYVAYTVCERARQRHGIVTVHANAVWTPRGAVLLLGDKGAGKTGTAVALAARGRPIIGDDLVLLALDGGQALRVLAGKRLARVRDPAAGYEAKSDVSLPESAPEAARVAAAVRVSVHPHVRTPRRAEGTPLSVVDRLRLHENVGRYIAGLPTPLSLDPAVAGPVYPLDDGECADVRSEIIARLPLTYLHAPTPEVAAGLIEEMIA